MPPHNNMGSWSMYWDYAKGLVKDLLGVDLGVFDGKIENWDTNPILNTVETLLRKAAAEYNKLAAEYDAEQIKYKSLTDLLEQLKAHNSELTAMMSEFPAFSSIRQALEKQLKPVRVSQPSAQRLNELENEVNTKRREVEGYEADVSTLTAMQGQSATSKAADEYKERVNSMYKKYFKET